MEENSSGDYALELFALLSFLRQLGPLPSRFERPVQELTSMLVEAVGDEDLEGADLSESSDGGCEESDEVMEDRYAPLPEIVAAVEVASGPVYCLTLNFIAEREGGLHEFALITRREFGDLSGCPDITVYDVGMGRERSFWNTVHDLRCQFGDVVWADLTAYKLGYGWRLDDVLTAVGLQDPPPA